MNSESNYETRSFGRFQLEVRVGKSLPALKGIAAPFGKLSEDLGGFRERIEPGAFQATIRGERRDVAAMREHKPELLLGRQSARTLEMRETAEGLFVRIHPPDSELGRSTVEAVRRGDLGEMSFSFRAVNERWERSGGEDIRVLRDLDVFDVSVVAFPAYPDTAVAVRSLEFWRGNKGRDLEYEYRRRQIDMPATGSSNSLEREYEYRLREIEMFGGSSLRTGRFTGILNRSRAERSRRIARLAERRLARKRWIEFEGLPAVHARHDERREFVNWCNARGFDIVRVATDPDYHQLLKREFQNVNWVPVGEKQIGGEI